VRVQSLRETSVWQELLTAIGLLLVLEGILPFLRPDLWREGGRQIARMEDRALRIAGLVSMIAGVILIYLIR